MWAEFAGKAPVSRKIFFGLSYFTKVKIVTGAKKCFKVWDARSRCPHWQTSLQPLISGVAF